MNGLWYSLQCSANSSGKNVFTVIRLFFNRFEVKMCSSLRKLRVDRLLWLFFKCMYSIRFGVYNLILLFKEVLPTLFHIISTFVLRNYMFKTLSFFGNFIVLFCSAFNYIMRTISKSETSCIVISDLLKTAKDVEALEKSLQWTC